MSQKDIKKKQETVTKKTWLDNGMLLFDVALVTKSSVNKEPVNHLVPDQTPEAFLALV